MYIYIYMYIYICVCMCVCVYVCVYVCMCVYVFECVCLMVSNRLSGMSHQVPSSNYMSKYVDYGDPPIKWKILKLLLRVIPTICHFI